MMDAATTPASDNAARLLLEEANRILLQRRAELKEAREAHGCDCSYEKDGPEAPSGAAPPRPPSIPSEPSSALEDAVITAVIASQPHLGWHSENVAAAMRLSHARRERAAREAAARSLAWLPELPQAAANTTPQKPTNTDGNLKEGVKLYPDVALGMLQQELEAAGRIWLLLRYLDEDGRGWISIKQARHVLTKKQSELHVCGWRQLRNLLRQGQGVFWERDKERIWLRSTAKVASALDVTRLTGRPVELPASVLCSGVGEIRAHFYASFHSGRVKQDREPLAAPIARATLEEVTGVPPRTQREYEKRAGVNVQENYAIGEPETQTALQERAWEHGRAVFTLTDKKGIHGRKDAKYIAWQLPNSYAGPHEQRARGRQRELNRQLAGLRDRRDAGNGRGEDQEARCQERDQSYSQRYYKDGGAAGKAYNRDPRSTRHWKGRPTADKRLWYTLAAQNG